MTLGPLMLDIEGLELTPEDKVLLKKPTVGGVILFSRNFHSLSQLETLVAQIHALRSPPLLIAVDQEGGRVQRFKDGFSILPAMRRFGEIYDQDPLLGKFLAKECGWLMASEIRSTGIDLSFAPVLDLDKGISSVIGNRAFHSQARVVALLGQAFVEGMGEAGMHATGKHFPGHGSIAADSHIAMPIDERRYADMQQDDIYPFRFMVDAGIHALMIAHVIYSNIDRHAAGFSEFWLQKILRDELGFQGAIFSDDLIMEGAAVAGNYVERAEQALQAGCDMILVCNHRAAAIEVLDALQDYENPASSLRLAHLHGTGLVSREDLVKQERWMGIKKQLSKYLDEPSGILNW